MRTRLGNILRKYQHEFHSVVPFNPKKDKIIGLDLTAANGEMTEEIFNETDKFSEYIDKARKNAKAKYLIGGYNELRAVYSRSELFNGTRPTILKTGAKEPEPRRLHLGVDIWGEVGTIVYAPLGGMVHSFAFNNHYGDYGSTIILLHQLDGIPFYTLYGHLSLEDLTTLQEGKYVSRGDVIGHFGKPNENGHWPPHLHFQVIEDVELNEGDYPGVCKYSERERYLENCPDPDLILRMQQYLI